MSTVDTPDTPAGRSHEPPPGVGRPGLWILLFIGAAPAVVLGGISFT
ncbi:hypothetical protein AB5J72_19385 [Streptomyces sp. CG1]